MQRLADEVSVTNAKLEDVEFTGGDGISFCAAVSLDLEGLSRDPDGGTWTSEESYSCRVTGYLSGRGFEIGSVR